MDNSVPEKIFDIRLRSLKFAVLIIKLSFLLPRNAAGYAIASQIVRSGTSIGANIHEAQDSSSKKEFTHSMTISLKEARETEYWLFVIQEADLINNSMLTEALREIKELIKILTTIVKKSKIGIKR